LNNLAFDTRVNNNNNDDDDDDDDVRNPSLRIRIF
jgi:hypothetical protein